MRLTIHRLTFALALVGLTIRCGGTFEPDPIDPRLPRYSEEGLNAAGAFVNGVRWRAVRGGSFPGGISDDMTIERDSSQVRISIDGSVAHGSPLEIMFHLDNTDGGLNRISSLMGRKFPLDGPHYATVRGQGNRTDELSRCPSQAGQLYIKRLKVIGTDYLLSGTFSFTVAIDSCTHYEVRSGRFDYRVEGN